ncbi:ureidoglycolate lyase [Marinobacterium litorale]|jgi:ureidoglycolate lyase|uniref:ureidoglycolate lyase n=1 Tax=Marinobacterium litorale TaxID=404770 RepID=UPI0003F6A26E|nr:ureidoglycolate lyase [Marinobacterium litorale]
MKLKPQAITAENFSPFGDLIQTGSDPMIINYGNTERHHDLARLDLTEQGGTPLVSIFRSKPLPLPLTLEVMERHPLASQAFIPMGSEPYLVAVAPAGEFDLKALKLFIVQPGQGVNYHRGTWHHYCLALNSVSDFIVIDRGGDGHNCDEIPLPQPIEVDLSDCAELQD